MLLNENDIAARCGLPGPIVEELLAGHAPTHQAGTARFTTSDLLRAQTSYLMFTAGVRWPEVKHAIADRGETLHELQARRDMWMQRSPVAWPAYPWSSHSGAATVTALMIATLLAGIMLGLMPQMVNW